jgi:transposase
MPLCSPFPGPLSVLIMDNARIHHGEGILALSEQFSKDVSSYFRLFLKISIDIRIEFLPPYSPDLNPIEEAFSKVKAFLRRHHRLLTKTGYGMVFELMEIMKIVTDDDAIGFFIHAGYF